MTHVLDRLCCRSLQCAHILLLCIALGPKPPVRLKQQPCGLAARVMGSHDLLHVFAGVFVIFGPQTSTCTARGRLQTWTIFAWQSAQRRVDHSLNHTAPWHDGGTVPAGPPRAPAAAPRSSPHTAPQAATLPGCVRPTSLHLALPGKQPGPRVLQTGARWSPGAPAVRPTEGARQGPGGALRVALPSHAGGPGSTTYVSTVCQMCAIRCCAASAVLCNELPSPSKFCPSEFCPTCLVCNQRLQCRTGCECHSVVCCKEPLTAGKVHWGVSIIGTRKVQCHPQWTPAGMGPTTVDLQYQRRWREHACRHLCTHW